MQKTNKLQECIKVFATCLCLIVLSGLSAHADDQKVLRGEPFSDPEYIQEMPSEWMDQSIKYDPAVGDADLVISLNQQFIQFLEPIIHEYGKKHKLKIVINKGTCGITAGMLAGKKGDIGGLCCPPAKTDRLPGLRYNTIGIHPISILVNPANPVNDVTSDQVREIFRGDISRWSALGWHDKAISLVGRLHCKKRPGHWRLILDNEDLFAPELRTVGAIEDMFSLVSSDRESIGYEVLWMSQKQESKVRSLKIDGHAPDDLTNLLEGNYPFYRVLYLSTWESENTKKPHAQKLVQYMTEQLEHIGSEVGIIPASRLRQAGWKFRGTELVGEPR